VADVHPRYPDGRIAYGVERRSRAGIRPVDGRRGDAGEPQRSLPWRTGSWGGSDGDPRSLRSTFRSAPQRRHSAVRLTLAETRIMSSKREPKCRDPRLPRNSAKSTLRIYMAELGSSVRMSPNKKIVEKYYASTGTGYAPLLADDVELVDWDIGVPASGAITRGKAAYIQNRGHREFRSRLTRLTEEGNVVVAEGDAHGTKKDGGPWTVHFCDTYEIENGKVKRVSSFGVDVKGSA
jgi:uncharacterized protein